MRTLWQPTLVLSVAAVCVTVAAAQEMPLPEGTTVKLILLRQKSVQAELKLAPATVDKVMKFTHEQYEAAKKVLQLTEDERKERFKAMEKENKKFIADNLKPDQRKRLNQITMQLTGLTQLTRPEIVKELKLTEEQLGKVKQLQKEARKNLAKIIDTKVGRNDKLAKLREQTRENILNLLTEEQRVIARQMVGEPFTGELVFEEEESKDR